MLLLWQHPNCYELPTIIGDRWQLAYVELAEEQLHDGEPKSPPPPPPPPPSPKVTEESVRNKLSLHFSFKKVPDTVSTCFARWNSLLKSAGVGRKDLAEILVRKLKHVVLERAANRWHLQNTRDVADEKRGDGAQSAKGAKQACIHVNHPINCVREITKMFVTAGCPVQSLSQLSAGISFLSDVFPFIQFDHTLERCLISGPEWRVPYRVWRRERSESYITRYRSVFARLTSN